MEGRHTQMPRASTQWVHPDQSLAEDLVPY